MKKFLYAIFIAITAIFCLAFTYVHTGISGYITFNDQTKATVTIIKTINGYEICSDRPLSFFTKERLNDISDTNYTICDLKDNNMTTIAVFKNSTEMTKAIINNIK